ncbi:MAG: DNA cytosine methyltransferase, partial [Planctomycetia bacterium]
MIIKLGAKQSASILLGRKAVPTERAVKPPRRRNRAASFDKTFCEFFAGIGLVGEGLAPGGWRCVYANDLDPKKLALYVARHGAAGPYHLGDVFDTPTVVEKIPGRPLLATASFPCTDLSLAGGYRGFAGRQSSTFFGFIDALHALGARRPPLVLLENVVGFL